MSDRIGFQTKVALAGVAALLLGVAVPAAQPQGLQGRIVHTSPEAYRPLQSVHAGAGSMLFAALLDRGAVTPEFNFLHRGEIPPGAGIGHHFHNVAEEMFVILNGEAQFTIDGRTARCKSPARKTKSSYAVSDISASCALALVGKSVPTHRSPPGSVLRAARSMKTLNHGFRAA